MGRGNSDGLGTAAGRQQPGAQRAPGGVDKTAHCGEARMNTLCDWFIDVQDPLTGVHVIPTPSLLTMQLPEAPR
jgi:hypothetical protein